MLQTIAIVGAAFYLTIAACLFTQWAEIVQQNIRQRSQLLLLLLRIFLATVALFWPLVIPIAYLELLNKVKKDKEKTLWLSEQGTESFASTTPDDSLLL
jgi:NADH:ubiquinone oxidoreductase subunit 6 (subunit J)